MSGFADALRKAVAETKKATPLYSFESKELAAVLGQDDPVVIFHKSRTLKAATRSEKRAKGNSDDLVVYTIIYEALDAKGEPLFDVGDKEFLKSEMHPQVLISISNQLCEFKGFEAQKKSSSKT